MKHENLCLFNSLNSSDDLRKLQFVYCCRFFLEAKRTSLGLLRQILLRSHENMCWFTKVDSFVEPQEPPLVYCGRFFCEATKTSVGLLRQILLWSHRNSIPGPPSPQSVVTRILIYIYIHAYLLNTLILFSTIQCSSQVMLLTLKSVMSYVFSKLFLKKIFGILCI